MSQRMRPVSDVECYVTIVPVTAHNTCFPSHAKGLWLAALADASSGGKAPGLHTAGGPPKPSGEPQAHGIPRSQDERRSDQGPDRGSPRRPWRAEARGGGGIKRTGGGLLKAWHYPFPRMAISLETPHKMEMLEASFVRRLMLKMTILPETS